MDVSSSVMLKEEPILRQQGSASGWGGWRMGWGFGFGGERMAEERAHAQERAGRTEELQEESSALVSPHEQEEPGGETGAEDSSWSSSLFPTLQQCCRVGNEEHEMRVEGLGEGGLPAEPVGNHMSDHFLLRARLRRGGPQPIS